jgi:hypothetical protein
MDCIACHVVDPNGADKIVDMGNGSAIPQVWHADSTGDLAGGNFKAINDGGSRKGHNVADLFAGGDNNGGTYGAPPGKFRDSTHGPSFTGAAPFSKFTCAGQGGCHGTRSQLLGGSTNDNGTSADSSDDYFVGVARVGIPAVSGAHHANFDGAKNADENYNGANGTGAHSGAKVADGYRMIPGLQGYGNVAARWQNVDETSHNEYFGAPLSLSTSCGTCHNEGLNAGTDGGSNRLTTDSTIKVPNQSMSGFCATCHGVFHSVGTGAASLSDGVGKGNNGVSGAFQRHPSDFVIPNEREYANYQLYTVTAPVARPTLYTAADSVVYPGTDMVMCLSCHKAHASDFDYMLRFDTLR